MNLTVSWLHRGGVLFALVDGRIDSTNAFNFEQAVSAETDDGADHLVFDFERVSFISSSGLRICLLTAKRYNKLDKSFGLCSLPAPVREVMKISGFDQIIALYSSQKAAIKSIGGIGTGEDPEPAEQEEFRGLEVKNEIDFGIVKDNIADIAQYAIEKYEYQEDTTLAGVVKDNLVGEIHTVLWQYIDRLKTCREQVLADMFQAADDTLLSIVGK